MNHTIIVYIYKAIFSPYNYTFPNDTWCITLVLMCLVTDEFIKDASFIFYN